MGVDHVSFSDLLYCQTDVVFMWVCKLRVHNQGLNIEGVGFCGVFAIICVQVSPVVSFRIRPYPFHL